MANERLLHVVLPQASQDLVRAISEQLLHAMAAVDGVSIRFLRRTAVSCSHLAWADPSRSCPDSAAVTQPGRNGRWSARADHLHKAGIRALLVKLLERFRSILLGLNRLEEAAQIVDPDRHLSRVGIIHRAKHRPPHRHLRRSMRRRFSAKLQNGNDLGRWKFAMIFLAQHGQIHRLLFHGRGSWAISSAVFAVARRAIAHIHLPAICCISLRRFDDDR